MKSLRQIFSNLRHALQSGVRQQITSTGLIFSLLVALIGVAAFASANNLLFLLLAALLATLLISGFVSRLGLAGLQLDIELPEHIAARKPVIMHFLVKNTKWWTPSFSITLSGGPKSALPAPIYIPVLPSNSVLREPVELRFDKRGVYRENLFQFSSRFPFDFTHRRERVWLEQEILVYPCIDPQPGFEMLLSEVNGDLDARIRGRGTEWYRVRPYEHFESARYVDWKATAHTGQLQVREFAKEKDPSIHLLLDLRVEASEAAWFEAAVDYCAFMVWRLSEQHTRIRFVTQHFDRTVPDETDVYTVLRYLARVVPDRHVTFPPIDVSADMHIAVCSSPERLAGTPWATARVVALEQLAAAIPRADAQHRSGAR
ncbi:MAG TPA: DUF58 domain-containing protein [Bryobacteraceae bacterium]|nr:DUF58 domain-containing protein [Bryobacteraceae bacterium]